VGNITLEHVEKVYDNGFHAVSDLSLEVNGQQFHRGDRVRLGKLSRGRGIACGDLGTVKF